MDSLNISTGEKRIPIVRDGVPAGEVVFNPSDVLFAEKFYRLLGEFQEKFTQYQIRSRELEKDTRTNGLGDDIPANLGERIALVKEACEYVYQQIDTLFGENTSQIVFGGALSLDAIQQFFSGVTPFIQEARIEKIKKYTNKRPKHK